MKISYFILARLKELLYIICYPLKGGVAQLVRASACHAEGRGFESRHSRQHPIRLQTFLNFLSKTA